MPAPNASKKRKSADSDISDDSSRAKRRKVASQKSSQLKPQPAESPQQPPDATTVGKRKEAAAQDPSTSKPELKARPPRPRINKLAPQRPFPTVPTSVSATGPRSAHQEGKNFICVTRKTKLGSYLRRCKDIIIKDGYKSLHLHALGAAIPHLTLLVTSLPSVLPFPANEMRTEIQTGTVEVIDEVLPDDDEHDVEYKTRGKSALSVTLIIGDGVKEPVTGKGGGSGRAGDETGNEGPSRKRKRRAHNTNGGDEKRIVIRASDQPDDMES